MGLREGEGLREVFSSLAGSDPMCSDTSGSLALKHSAYIKGGLIQ